ncbi:MAG: Stk1 family PASTA domain-containing Ser/Thr kinase, partial [Coriobacteriales bacterium]|nr:Stk1 family PASTA domain-containing Ser/Thr kinase [Coriobacteriales bacterium]
MIDRVFGSRYRIIERIGIGGMAEVYRATDQVLGRTVALKLMLPQYAADPTFAARFKQEAQAAANLQSPYIVNIYDWGRDDVDETFYIVMELVRGTDLKTAINQRGAINQRKAAEVASQVCAALAVAHGYDIIHRDIKPHNIMVQPDGNAKVMDFGIARANGSGMTQTGSVLGTAYYVSPEQAQGKELTPSTDLYSLGVVLYEAVTGKLPFEGEDAVTVALKQVNQLPAPPSTVYPDIDPELEAIIMRAIEKNPVDRYPTADAMRTALNNYLTGRPVEDGNVDAQAATTVIGATPTLRPEKRPERPVPEPVAIIQRPDTKVARTSVMPVATVGAPNGHNANALLQESRAKNRLPAIIVGIIAASLVIGFVVFLALNMLNSNTPDMVRVPNIIGMTEYDGERELTRNGLLVGEVNREPSDTVEKGKIISVDPRQNSLVYRGEKIDLLISSGTEAPVTKQVPNLANSDLDAAKQILEELGLKYSVEGEKYHESIEAGKVC